MIDVRTSVKHLGWRLGRLLGREDHRHRSSSAQQPDQGERRASPADPTGGDRRLGVEFHVSPENEIWKVERYGHSSTSHSTKSAAIAAAREQAMAARPALVIVHDEDGNRVDQVDYGAE